MMIGDGEVGCRIVFGDLIVLGIGGLGYFVCDVFDVCLLWFDVGFVWWDWCWFDVGGSWLFVDFVLWLLLLFEGLFVGCVFLGEEMLVVL